MKTNRKPFVAPKLKEEASLVGVTLISGQGHIRRQFKKDKKEHKEYHGHQS